MGKILLYEAPDISYHNGNVDIKRIRDSGCKRVGIRAGYGKNNVDQKYIANADACYNLGVDPLLYWFSYAYTIEMAASEARYAVAQAAKFWGKCPIAYDFEYDSVNYARKNGVNVTKELATDMAISFLKVVSETEYIPVIYTNKDYLKNYFDVNKILDAVGKVYVWYARYNDSLEAGEKDLSDVWQYTSKGRVDGISGNVDMNRFYTAFDESVKTVRENKCNLNILAFQKAANADGYRDQDGKKLAEDGIDGAKTQYVRKHIAMKAKYISESAYSTGSIGEVVKWWQSRCNEILGHEQEVDGKYGSNSRKETMAVQRQLSLKVDGIAGYNSIQAVFYN